MLVKFLVTALATITIFSNQIVTASAPVPVAKPLPVSIPEKIEYYAKKYNVSADIMTKVLFCESSMNPNAINNTVKEFSVGLSQINLMAHKNISVEQAKDPDFAIEFMAKNIGSKPQMWSCYSKIYG